MRLNPVENSPGLVEHLVGLGRQVMGLQALQVELVGLAQQE